jgi:nitroimidazol reductase NimA-like FMN-containing flavoprotein (pyridoxamine 5'-phosphate oxidase superfamily)
MKPLSPSLKEFCEKAELLRLAYDDLKGYPRVVPVWFVVIGGEYYFGTGAVSAKWKAIKNDSRVGWLIDDDRRDSYKGASFAGRAEEIADGDLRTKIYRALGEKYFGSADDPKFVEIYGQADDGETVYLQLKPERVFSWEY